jgi:hypothetical protein
MRAARATREDLVAMLQLGVVQPPGRPPSQLDARTMLEPDYRRPRQRSSQRPSTVTAGRDGAAEAGSEVGWPTCAECKSSGCLAAYGVRLGRRLART